LRQLREMLDAGTLTPAEFEALKQQLIFGPAVANPPGTDAAPAEPLMSGSVAPVESDTVAVASAAALSPTPAAPADSLAPAVAASFSELAAPFPVTANPADSPAAADAPVEAAPPVVEEVDTYAPPAAVPLRPQDWMAALAPSMVPVIEADRAPAAADPPAPDEYARERNPLTLIFAIGGVLLLLAVFGYLLFGLPPKTDEHLTSTSQTPADTVRTRPETGPQSEQLTLPPVAAPETVRVAPLPVARPVVPAAASTFRADSVVAPAKPAPARSNPDQTLIRDTAAAPVKP